MVPIKDFEGYTSRMEKGMLDKLWWLDMIPEEVENVYDFGCADGALLSAVHLLRPELKLSGYDINPDMVAAARKRVPLAYITDRPQDYLSSNTVVILSSVLHEIYSYAKDESDLDDTLDSIFNCGARYIAVRDMFYSKNMFYKSWPYDVISVRHKEPAEKVAQFESIWGPIDVNKNLIHYLLKYRYVENWEREVRENYFPVSIEDFIGKIIPDNYDIVYSEHYTLPYVEQRVREDFSIRLTDKTHAKLLLKRVN